MEERIIDDEYGRGVRLKKTKDGYVDVTDELAQNAEQTEYEETDEVAFEFPVLEVDEDDEDLVGLSPEEALALKKRKEEEAAQRKADYEKACEEGDKLLALGSFKAAEIEFEKALSLDEEAMEAFFLLSRFEGIIPAIESAHAVAYALRYAKEKKTGSILVCLSGRGDKDIDYVYENYGCGEKFNLDKYIQK